MSKDYLPSLLLDLENIELRGKIQMASMFAGLAISQTRTAIAHSISYPLTSHYNVPHGLACSYTLPMLISLFVEKAKIETHLVEQLLDVKSMLENFNLREDVLTYCSVEDVEAISSELVSPQRAANFILDLTVENIESIAIDSMKN